MPVRETVNVGLEVESVVTVSVPVRVPTAEGAKVTVIVHVAFSAREVQLSVSVKSLAFVPEIAIFEMATVLVKVVVFATVTGSDAVAPRKTSPKFNVVGEMDAVVGTGGIRKATTCPSCGVSPAAVVVSLVLMAAKSVEKCGCVTSVM